MPRYIQFRTDNVGRIAEVMGSDAASDTWQHIETHPPMVAFLRLLMDHGFTKQSVALRALLILGLPAALYDDAPALEYGAHGIVLDGPVYRCRYCEQSRPDPDDFWSIPCRS